MSSEPVRSGTTDEQKSALVERILQGEITPDEACREHGLTDAQLKEWVSVYRRVTRRAMEDQLSAALSARGLPAEEAPSEFTGGLDGQALAELLQTIEYGRKDAQIRIEHDGEHSQIWCAQGEIIDARSGRLASVGALYRLLALREGRLYAHFSRAERARTIHASTPALLLEAAKRADECSQLRQRIGDTGAIYVISPSAWDAQAQLEAETWQLLRAFDGVSSLERVVASSVSPELETLTAVQGLLDRQLIMVKPPPTSPQWLPLSTPPGSAAAPGSERSFVPLAQSLRARLTQPGSLRRRLWLSAAAGLGAVAVAFAIGFWSVRREAARELPPLPAPARAVASAGDWSSVADGGCPEGMSKVEGGPLFPHREALAAAADEVREPRVKAFCLARLEVTVAEFEACVAARGCEPAEREYDLRLARLDNPGSNTPPELAQQCNSGQAGRERHPINCVSFQQAQQFCTWRGGRLPSQSEWEYAASEVTPDPDEDHKGTLPVGSYPAGGTPEGILDLFGNVSEWTTGRIGLRPTSADEGERRQLYAVLGGGLQPGASRLGSRASRLYMNANARGRTVGFRCAYDLD